MLHREDHLRIWRMKLKKIQTQTSIGIKSSSIELRKIFTKKKLKVYHLLSCR